MGFFTGLFTVGVEYDEIKDQYVISGRTGFRNIINRYGEKNINNIFTSVGRTELIFPSIFAYEVIALFKDVIRRPNNYVDAKALKKALDLLEEKVKERVSLDLDCKLDFDMIKAKMKHTPFAYQMELFNHYEGYKARTGYRGLMVAAQIGVGKANRKTDKVRVPNGWTMIKDLKVGDLVMTVDGSYTKVEGVYPRGRLKTYKVKFKDGRSSIVAGDHLWAVHGYGFNKTSVMYPYFDFSKRLPVEDYTHQPTCVVDTLSLFDFMKRNRQPDKVKVYIPLCRSEQNEDKDFYIHPYILGVLLGDGHISGNKSICITCSDPKVIERCAQFLDRDSKITTHNRKDCSKQCLTYGITKKENVSGGNKYVQELRRLRLLGTTALTKFIPEEYLNSSTTQRLELIRGLMDTDGDVTRSIGRNGLGVTKKGEGICGSLNYSTSSPHLALDIRTLIHSLGDICKFRPKVPYYSYKGERLRGNVSYRLSIRSRMPSEYLTRWKKRKSRLHAENQYSKNLKLQIVSVEEHGEEECICIKVAHPSELYVMEDYIVTHNTNMSLTLAEMLHSEKVLIVCPLPTFEKVWLKSIVLPGNDNLYQRPEENKLWHVKSPSAYNNERFILVHYEGLENIYGILSKIAGPKTTVIVDESHNFADTKSKRTVLLQDIIDRSFTKNLFLLSGTPIKSYSTEVINMAKFIDGRLKGKLYERLYSVYANPNKFFKSILPNRYSDMTYVIEKKETKLDPIIKTYVPIKLKNGNEYTLPYIREQMRIFIEKRIKEINDAMPKYQEVYRMCIETARQNGFDKKSKYTIRQYEDLVAIIQKNYKSNNLGFIKNEMALANTIEKEIKKFLPPELARQWDEVKTIIKYPLLKIQGECLGLIVMGARIKCHVDMASNLDLSALVNSTIKDTIIFSNYIQVCEAARINVTNRGYKPALVYGELSKYLNREVKAFIDNKDINPLITTYKSLSTGVPLINANVIIALDLPFRMYIFEQAVGRAWRVGQDSQVVVYIPSLDTDNVPNINQRNLDIISFFNEEVEALTGIKSSMDIKETEALNLEAYSIAPDIRTSYFDMYLKDYDMSGYKHKLLNW